MSVHFGNYASLAVALVLGANFPAALADSVATSISSAELTLDESQESLLDALFEATYTLLAFVLAAMLIRYLQRRHAKHVKGRGKQRQEVAFNESVCSPHRVSKSAQRSVRTGAVAPASAAGNGAPKTARLQAPALDVAKKRNAIIGGNRSLVSECDAIVAAAYGGRAEELSSLLESAFARLVPSGADAAARSAVQEQFVQSALRICAGRRHFSAALTIYDQMVAQYGLQGTSDMWSVLLYCAVESNNFRRCNKFAAGLLDTTTPTGNDFVNMVRYSLATNDIAGFKQLVSSLRERDFELDNISHNRALAACVSNKTLVFATILVEEVAFAPALDIVGYNSFMKCCTKARDAARCFRSYSTMRAAGLVPSEVTFGILLDACNIANDVERAKDLFRELRENGLQANAIHYTSFMRVVASSGLLDRADELLEEMLQSSNAQPDNVTYSSLIKAHAEHGDVKGAMRVLERMIEQGARPDAITFNVIVGACSVNRMDSALVMHVYRRLEQHGMRTTTTSLSVLLKALARNEDWDASLQVLSEAPKRWHLQAEARLFAQVAQACHSANCGLGELYECYVAMIKSAVDAGLPVDMSVSSRLVRLCASCGQDSAATAIHDFLARSGGAVSGHDLELLQGFLPSQASPRRAATADVVS